MSAAIGGAGTATPSKGTSAAAATPGSAIKGGAGGELLTVLGYGSGGLADLQAKLPADNVTFAICRLVFGSGTFAREKTVLVHVNSDGCSGIKRGRINGKKGAVKAALGDINAEVVVTDVKDVTLEHVIDELRKVISADEFGSSFSVEKYKADYEAMCAKAKSEAAAEAGGAPSVALTRKTAAEMGDVKAEAALKSVKEPLGAWNWCLFTPEFAFVDAGSLSAPEMARKLKDDAFYYGLLRLGFGTGRFRRTKWVYFVWSGSKVGPAKRGVAASKRKEMKDRLGPASVDIEATTLEDASLQAMIDKVKRAAVVDGDEIGAETDPYSIDNFMKALAEEAAASADFFGDKGLQVSGGGGGGGDKTVAEVLVELRSKGTKTNWAAFTVNA